MNFYNKTEVFIVKRSIIIFLTSIMFSILIYNINKQIILGLTIGYFISLLRINAISFVANYVVDNAVNQKRKTSLMKYILIQIITIILLLFAVTISIEFFMAIFFGILLVPLTILINSLCELIGITRNNFE